MKKYCFLLFIFCTFLQAQTPIWGKNQNIPEPQCFFGEDESFIYGYRLEKEKNKNQFLVLSEEKIDFPSGSFSYLHAEIYQENILIFLQYFEKENAVLYFFSLDKNTKKITHTEIVQSLALNEPYDRSIYFQIFSNANHFFISNQKPLRMENYPGFFVQKIEKTGKSKNQQIFAFEEEKNDLIVKKIVEDSKKNTYILFQENQLKSLNTASLAPVEQKLLWIDAVGKREEITLQIENKYLATTELFLHPETEKLWIIGFFAYDKMGYYGGIFTAQLGEKMEVDWAHFTRIPPSFFANNKNSTKTLVNYQLENIAWKNNQMHLIAQEKWVESLQRLSAFEQQLFQDFYYHFLNIAYFVIDEKGQLQSSYKLPKKQITLNDQGKYNGYILMPEKDFFGFVFLDHPRNLHRNHSLKAMDQPKQAIISWLSIRADGKIEKKQLPLSAQQRYVLLPKLQYQSKHGLFVFAKEQEDLRIGRLIVEE